MTVTQKDWGVGGSCICTVYVLRVAGNDVPVVCLVSSGTWRCSVLSAVRVTQKVSVFMMAMKNNEMMMNVEEWNGKSCFSMHCGVWMVG